MYHALVRRIATANFEKVNQHDYVGLLAACRPDVRHRFGGEHALGGERRDREAFGRWLERLGRLVPDMRLQVRDVWVAGWPHDTTVIIRWVNEASRPGGGRYENHGVHVISMRWGKVVEIDANEDSQAVVGLLDELAGNGVEEAAAPAITS